MTTCRPSRQSFAAACLLLVMVLSAIAGEPASGPDPAAGPPADDGDFVVEAEMPYRAHLRATGIFINAFHLTKPTKEVVDSIKAQPKRSRVTVIICRGAQEQMIKDFWDVSDQYIFEALFRKPEWSPPPKDTLIWPGFDHPMINYVRKIRMASSDKKAIVSVPMTCREVWGVPRERPELFDELKWMTMAVIGANYQGILWGHVRREEEWNQMVQELTSQLKPHAADLGAATPVDWVKAPEGQPVSALASDRKLFITLLNTDYMKVNADRTRISGALNPGRRQGRLKLSLPAGFTADAAATLDGLPVEITQDMDGLTCAYDFTAGGEMIIVTIKRSDSSEPSATPSSHPADGDPLPQSAESQ
jgi:hypothetical protein